MQTRNDQYRWIRITLYPSKDLAQSDSTDPLTYEWSLLVGQDTRGVSKSHMIGYGHKADPLILTSEDAIWQALAELAAERLRR